MSTDTLRVAQIIGNKSLTAEVAYCFDGNYELPFGVALSSLLHSNPSVAFQIHCLVENISTDVMRRLESTAHRYGAVVNIYDIGATTWLEGLPPLGHITPITYARLFLPHVLPAAVSRVIYLDADTVTCGPIDTLINLDLAGQGLAAVEDIASVVMGPRVNLGLDYFNAGVMVIDLDHWRRNSVTDACFAIFRAMTARGQFVFAEQDLLNVHFSGRFLKLSGDFNVGLLHQFGHEIWGHHIATQNLTPNSRIAHYLGRNKPHMGWYEGPGLQLFERFKAISDWHDVAPLQPTQLSDLFSLTEKQLNAGDTNAAIRSLKNGIAALADHLAKLSSPTPQQ